MYMIQDFIKSFYNYKYYINYTLYECRYVLKYVIIFNVLLHTMNMVSFAFKNSVNIEIILIYFTGIIASITEHLVLAFIIAFIILMLNKIVECRIDFKSLFKMSIFSVSLPMLTVYTSFMLGIDNKVIYLISIMIPIIIMYKSLLNIKTIFKI